MKLRDARLFPLFLLLSVLTTGCNLFDPLDSPTSDPQLLSAARAAFDRGDMDKARELYSKLSPDYSEVAASDSAFTILNSYGATMAAFMSAFGAENPNAGKALTLLAGSLSDPAQGGAAGKAKRLALLEAFQKTQSIKIDRDIRGLVRFVTAFALAAELLAERAGTPGTFVAGDVATNASACRGGGAPPICALNNGCDAVAERPLNKGTRLTTDEGDDRLPKSGTAGLDVADPTLFMFHAAINEVSFALSNEIGAGGKLGDTATQLSSSILAIFAASLTDADPNAVRCYRYGLLLNGIGSN